MLIQCLVQKFSREKFWQKIAILRILRFKGERGWAVDFFFFLGRECAFSPSSLYDYNKKKKVADSTSVEPTLEDV